MAYTNTDNITPEDLYRLKIEYEGKNMKAKKTFDRKKYNQEYYQKHKNYFKSKTSFNRSKKK